MHPAFAPVSTYVVICSWPSGCATIWETDLTSLLTKEALLSQMLDGQFDNARRVLFADEQKGIFKDASKEIAEALAEEIVERSTSNGKISRAALSFCEIHGVKTPAYLRKEVA